MTVYFDTKGRGCTEETAKLALQRGVELGIEHFVVASNTGFTARHFVGKVPNLVCVTHQVGFKEPGGDEMSRETRKELKDKGVEILTTTHLMGGIERAVTGQYGGLYPGYLIANSLRMLSQGVKVGVEISVMALDSGLIPYGKPVIAVGGSGGGADTAIVIVPSHAKTFFEAEILELVCKPRSPKG